MSTIWISRSIGHNFGVRYMKEWGAVEGNSDGRERCCVELNNWASSSFIKTLPARRLESHGICVCSHQ